MKFTPLPKLNTDVAGVGVGRLVLYFYPVLNVVLLHKEVAPRPVAIESDSSPSSTKSHPHNPLAVLADKERILEWDVVIVHILLAHPNPSNSCPAAASARAFCFSS